MTDWTPQKHRNEIHEISDRIVRSIVLNLPQDPEDFVVLRGSTEALIALAEAAKVEMKIPMPDVSMAVRERNERKPAKDKDDNRCRFCGNPVVADNSWFIHEDGSGNNIWHNDVPESIYKDDTYGCHPIGPECAKKIPVAYRYKFVC